MAKIGQQLFNALSNGLPTWTVLLFCLHCETPLQHAGREEWGKEGGQVRREGGGGPCSVVTPRKQHQTSGEACIRGTETFYSQRAKVSCFVQLREKKKMILDGDAHNLEPGAVGGSGPLQQLVGLLLVLLVQGEVSLFDLPLERLEELLGLLPNTNEQRGRGVSGDECQRPTSLLDKCHTKQHHAVRRSLSDFWCARSLPATALAQHDAQRPATRDSKISVIRTKHGKSPFLAQPPHARMRDGSATPAASRHSTGGNICAMHVRTRHHCSPQ